MLVNRSRGTPIARPARSGVTLIELLVTMVVSSVVIIGLGSLFAGAAGDFERAARMREERYSRQSLESELAWRTKVVPPEFLPTGPRPSDAGGNSGQIPRLGRPPAPGFQITFTDERGLQVRKVLAFDYLRNDTRTEVLVPDNPPGFVPPGYNMPVYGLGLGAGCPSLIPQNSATQRVTVRTAAVFQYFSGVYVVERDIASAAESFRVMANAGDSALENLLKPMFNDPPVIVPGVIPPTPLAMGIDLMDFGVLEPQTLAPCGSDGLRDAIRTRRVSWAYSQYYISGN